ncbi:hypothetical protein BDV26DRAFT_258337 [Aspergillus bertholletiae]|uniref:Uncharacterized protein n=1 Tax=Aspergillus bertholletiae TaxID=1226010 RepID=A0A5N7BDX4_9EURO|nr:hypothetical protein BDV26DRAFT_258337 [Aspergillus bertholletiae]
MPQQNMTIPLRTSSVNAVSNGMHMSGASHEDLRRESASKKAQKILGTTEIPILQDQSRREDRKSRGTSFMRAPDIKSKKSGGFAAFPTPTPETTLPPPHLRVRASSPLLGQEYRSQDATPPPIHAHSKRVQQSGSSSTLFSYFNSRNSTMDSNLSRSTIKETKTTEEQKHNLEPRYGFKQPKGPMKESKRKMRPPRIDLSHLFPKPRVDAAPLLSPQRLVNSPSAISLTSEHPAAKPKDLDSPPNAKRATKTPPSSHERRGHQTADPASEPSPIYESSNTNWLDPSLERTVRTSEMDMALKRYSQFQKAPQPSEVAQPSQSHLRPRGREQPQASDAKSAESSLRKVPSNGSAGGWSRELYLSPKSFSRPHNKRVSNSSNARHADSRENLSAYKKSSMSKKGSKSTLKNVDLTKSSVLCLSSSEDEEDEEEAPSKHDKNLRDSVTTYGELEAEICTASAAQTTKGTLRQVERPYSMSASSRGSQSIRRQQQTILRNPSMSSAGRSTLDTRSHRSSGVPTISELDFLNTDPMVAQPRKPTQRVRLQQTQQNRRSRVIAVTRQEENLLEAMRQRKGKITPSLFQEARYQDSLEPDRNSMLSVPSRDSFYGSDISFLRLSPGLPSMLRKDQGANHFDKDGSISQGAASDAEQKTINSGVSPRASLIYSESLPSPATSGASPLTPTLPIHRFSPLPSQKPPPRNPPPAVPSVQRRHSRRRTDSSEAIVLDDAEERKGTDDFPIWALGWASNDNANLTAVH